MTMDPYSGTLPAPSAPSSFSSFLPGKKVLILVACILILGVIGVVVLRKKTPPPPSSPSDIAPTQRQGVTKSTKSTKPVKTTASVEGIEGELKWVSSPPEAKLATFAFESKTRPKYVPNQQGRIAIIPSGNPPYKLVGCDSVGAYAIRWNGRYLTVDSPNLVKWTEEKLEPGSCFKIVPGYCGGGEYIMLRSVANKLVLRADDTYGQLVCKDTPTARTADSYCWKLNPTTTSKQPCGPQYSYDLGRIVDIPCNVKEMPDGNASCSTVTAGYQAKCCTAKGQGAAHDTFCEATIFPKVVGKSLQEAILYIRTRRPDLSLKPCPEPCTTEAIPIQSPNLVIIPYDARSNVVTSVPRRLV